MTPWLAGGKAYEKAFIRSARCNLSSVPRLLLASVHPLCFVLNYVFMQMRLCVRVCAVVSKWPKEAQFCFPSEMLFLVLHSPPIFR